MGNTRSIEEIIGAVSENILLGIVRAGLSKNAVAEKAGIPASTFSRKLNRQGGEFSLLELGDIADALGLTLPDLLPAELLEKEAV